MIYPSLVAMIPEPSLAGETSSPASPLCARHRRRTSNYCWSLIILDAHHRRDDLLCHLLGVSSPDTVLAGWLSPTSLLIVNAGSVLLPELLTEIYPLLIRATNPPMEPTENHQASHHTGYNFQGYLFCLWTSASFLFRLPAASGLPVYMGSDSYGNSALPHHLALALAVIMLCTAVGISIGV